MKICKNTVIGLCFFFLICQNSALFAFDPAQLPENTVSFDIDNDCFVAHNKDKDYTYSLGFNYTSTKKAYHNWFFHLPLAIFNDYLFDQQPWDTQATDFGMGVFGFTPRKKTITKTMPSDRPYASLNYISVTGLYLNRNKQGTIKSSFTLGLLGMNSIQTVQNFYHKLAGYNKVKGWGNQISKGGELTVKYAIESQKVLKTGVDSLQLMYAYEASLGYITEVSVSIYMRIGKILTPWWHHQPNGNSYGEKPFTLSPFLNESFFMLGIVGKLRGYNSFLQSQFRQSRVLFKANEVRPFIRGVWLGYKQTFQSGFSLSYQVNFQSSEIVSGLANRPITWGSIILSQSW